MKEIEIFSGDFTGELRLQYADGGIFCGFPSPAQDYIDRTLNFNEDIIRHPSATFYAKAMGDSMIEAGIEEGDILVIDRALEPQDGDIVIAHVNGEFTVKYLDISKKDKGIVKLIPGNPRYEPIVMHEGDQLIIWGVVSNIIKRLNNQVRFLNKYDNSPALSRGAVKHIKSSLAEREGFEPPEV